MDNFGSGVEYISPDCCIIVGIGALSGAGSPPSADSLLLSRRKLGRRMLDTLLMIRPKADGVVLSSSNAELSGPRVLVRGGRGVDIASFWCRFSPSEPVYGAARTI